MREYILGMILAATLACAILLAWLLPHPWCFIGSGIAMVAGVGAIAIIVRVKP